MSSRPEWRDLQLLFNPLASTNAELPNCVN
jgi:hypothetical protein